MKKIYFSMLVAFSLLASASVSANEVWGGKCKTSGCWLKVSHIKGKMTSNGKQSNFGWLAEGCFVGKVKSDLGEATLRTCGAGGGGNFNEKGKTVSWWLGPKASVWYKKGCNASIRTIGGGHRTRSKVVCPKPKNNKGKRQNGKWR